MKNCNFRRYLIFIYFYILNNHFRRIASTVHMFPLPLEPLFIQGFLFVIRNTSPMFNTLIEKKGFEKALKFLHFQKILHLYEYLQGYFRVTSISAYERLKAWNTEKMGTFW